MAHRFISQIILVGGRTLGRSLLQAYKQASASSAYQRAQAKANPGGGGRTPLLATSMTLDEAVKILNVKPLKGAQTDMEDVMARFKKLFDTNDPKNGGSFYLQSKILRARERIDAEIQPLIQRAAMEAEMKSPPKMYRR
ncbi:protein transporter [Xylariaceae sp. FL0804]|nr:protein transporter [Xylariaceae sp. FL0804]